jgi:hypothetical protein
MNAPESVVPTIPGTSLGGGIYAGRFFIEDKPFALVVAPKADGAQEDVVWNKSRKNVTGATSWCDGLANTQAMAKAGSAVAQWALDLRIGGFDDWYLPSRAEALLMFGGICVDAGDEGELEGWHWTSTQYAGSADYAWFQYFDDGNQDGLDKSSELRARAVRRVPI